MNNKADRNESIWQLFCADVSTKEIAKQFSLSPTMVRVVVNHHPDYEQVLREKHYKKYSIDTMKAMIQVGKNKVEIGQSLGLSRTQVKYAFTLFPELDDLYLRRTKPDHEQDRTIIWELHQQGNTYEQIRQVIGRSKQYVERRLYEHPDYVKKSTMSEQRRTQIRLLRLDGKSLQEIAEWTGISPRDVGKALRRSRAKLKRHSYGLRKNS